MFKIIDTRDLSDSNIETHVQEIVRGASTAKKAEQRLEARLSPSPLAWVQECGDSHWSVLIQVLPGATNCSIMCER